MGVPVGFDAQAVGMTSALLPWVLDSPHAVKRHCPPPGLHRGRRFEGLR